MKGFISILLIMNVGVMAQAAPQKTMISCRNQGGAIEEIRIDFSKPSQEFQVTLNRRYAQAFGMLKYYELRAKTIPENASLNEISVVEVSSMVASLTMIPTEIQPLDGGRNFVALFKSPLPDSWLQLAVGRDNLFNCRTIRSKN